MVKLHRIATWLAVAAAATPMLLSKDASAQADVTKPMSNVLLLVDTSGSMEFITGAFEFPQCTADNPSGPNERSRWIDLVEALTGTLEGYSCFAQDRSSSGFASEYDLGTTSNLYDLGYINPYHRLLSNGCAKGPGVRPASNNPFGWNTKMINTFNYQGGSIQRPPDADLGTWGGCTHVPGFVQLEDGVLDVFADKLRFGLMTFDSRIHAGTGLLGSNPSYDANYNGGNLGTWSYYLDDPVNGWPEGCGSPIDQEVGARNGGAPPWEGRMIAFGPWDDELDETKARNAEIQEILLAQRPYGATPIAGLLHDAREFLWKDDDDDPRNPTYKFGPLEDPTTLQPECRKTTIILLSDGEPNLDLRPECLGGKCPYELPEEIAEDLITNPPNPTQKVETIVIGFALERVTPASGTEVSCDQLTDTDCDIPPPPPGTPPNRPLEACCTLNKIAAKGGYLDSSGNPKKAFFAEDKTALRKIFTQILTQLSDSVSTRTSATFARNTVSGGGFQFNSGFTPELEDLWKGTLTRTRTVCENGVPTEKSIRTGDGDDFVANVNSVGAAERKFWTVNVTSDDNEGSVRPGLSSDVDGVGINDGDQTSALNGAGFVAALSVEETAITGSDCPAGVQSTCKNDVLGYVVGLTTSDGRSRCPNPPTDCNQFGAIYHSTPVVVQGAPDAGLRDESYRQFEAIQEAAQRPTVMYLSSIDGFLHAFRVAPYSDPSQEIDSVENNELWAFAPPAVLKFLKTQFNTEPVNLLDGAPVVKDVPARVLNGKTYFERTVGDAQGGSGEWRTVLVQSFGDGAVANGYFAIDITNPLPGSATTGPRFLWQLTKDSNGDPLFGGAGTPEITTLFIANGSGEKQEVAVAILPGGTSGTRLTPANPSDPAPSIATEDPLVAVDPSDNVLGQRKRVNPWDDDSYPSRSVTIVRLDSGEILRTFRDKNSPDLTIDDAREDRTLTIAAPMLGVPVAYPATTGTVADRAFIGDREGMLWRLDLGSSDPTKWSMKIFYDLYRDLASGSDDDAQPIETAPVLSVDTSGSVTVNVSSGAQSFVGQSSSTVNRLVALRERLTDTNVLQAQLKWQESFSGGERVTGPMSLHDGVLYFATGSPPTADAAKCLVANNRVWGLNYIQSADEVAGNSPPSPTSGGAPGLLTTVGSNPVKNLPSRPGVVFGVDIEYQPTCSDGVDNYSGDAYAGLGLYRTTRNTVAGQTFLVYQVGGVASTTSQDGTREVPRVRIQLVPPERPVLIESWALVSE